VFLIFFGAFASLICFLVSLSLEVLFPDIIVN